MSGFRTIRHGTPRGWQVPDLAEPQRLVRSRAALRGPPPLAAPEPVFTPADIAAAREQGEAAGRREAVDEAHALAAAATQQVADALAGSSATMAAFAERAATRLAGLVAEALAVAFPAIEKALGPTATARLVAGLLPGLADLPLVAVRVSPCAAGALQPYLNQLGHAQRERIELLPDPACDDGDVWVEWQGGAAVRDSSAIREAVLAAVRSLATNADLEEVES